MPESAQTDDMMFTDIGDLADDSRTSLRVSVYDEWKLDLAAEALGTDDGAKLRQVVVPERFRVVFGDNGVWLEWLDADGYPKGQVTIDVYGGHVTAQVWDESRPEGDPVIEHRLGASSPLVVDAIYTTVHCGGPRIMRHCRYDVLSGVVLGLGEAAEQLDALGIDEYVKLPNGEVLRRADGTTFAP